jgi:hypothetical protein
MAGNAGHCQASHLNSWANPNSLATLLRAAHDWQRIEDSRGGGRERFTLGVGIRECLERYGFCGMRHAAIDWRRGGVNFCDGGWRHIQASPRRA